MPKIPRSRDYYETYKPSAPVLTPMSLADYSAWSDALDKGAAFAAKKYHQKQDAEANLNRNIFANDGDNFLLEEEERSQKDTDEAVKTGNVSSFESLSTASEERVNQWMEKNYHAKSELFGSYPIGHRTALEITKQNIEAKAKALRLKMSSNHIASVAQKQRVDWENQIITNITDMAVPYDKTMNDVQRTMKVRYELSMAGGKLESPEQFAVNQRALQLRIGKATVERYKSGFIDMIVGNYIHKKSDLFSGITDQKDVSVGKWNSYGDWLFAVKDGEYKEFFPEKTSLQLAQEINKEVQSALVTAQAARDKAGKLQADSYLNDLLVNAINNGVTPSPVQFERLQAYFDAAGARMPAMAFNFFNKIQTEPNANQKNYFRELEAEIATEVLIASALNSPPVLTEFFNKVREGATSEALHPKGVSTLLGQLLGEQKGVNKDANAMAGRILKMVSDEFKTFKRAQGERDSRWKITTQLLGTDLDFLVRQMTLEAFRNAQGSRVPVNESELTNAIIGNLTNSMSGKDPAKINIPRKVLEDVFGKVVANQEDAKNNPLDALDKAIFRMAKVKMERNGRFLNSTLAKEYKEAIIRRGGSVYQYPTQLPAQAEKDLDEEIGFLFPGEFSYRQLYNQFFGKKEEDVVKEKQEDDQDIDLPDPNAKVEEPAVEESVGDSADEEAVGSVDEANLSNEQKNAAVLNKEQQNIESAPEISMSIASEGGSAPEGELVAETSAEEVVAVNKEYYDRVDQFRRENKDMSFSQRMSKLTGAKSAEERARYVSDWIYESDKVLNSVLGPAWADLKQSFREDNAAFGRLADAIVKEYGDLEHKNPPLEELPRLMMQAVHPTAKNFTQWLRNALYGGGGIEPTVLESDSTNEFLETTGRREIAIRDKSSAKLASVPEGTAPMGMSPRELEVGSSVASPKSPVVVRKESSLPKADLSVNLPKTTLTKEDMLKPLGPLTKKKTVVAKKSKKESVGKAVKKKSAKQVVKAPITGSPLERALAATLAAPENANEIVRLRKLPRTHKGPTIMEAIRGKILNAVKRTKKAGASLASLGGDLFSPKQRAEDIATALERSGWIKIENQASKVGKLGLKRGDAYNYLFQLSVEIFRNKNISEVKRDEAMFSMRYFNKIHRDASGLDPVTRKQKSQKVVDDYVVDLVREFEAIIFFDKLSRQFGAL